MTRLRRFLLRSAPAGALAFALVATSGGVSAAKTPTAAQKQKQEQIATLRDQVQEASADEAALLDRFDSARQARQELDARVADVDGQLATEQHGLDDATARLNVVEEELVRAQLKLDFAQQQVALAHDQLRRRAVAAYINEPASQAANYLLQVRSIRDLAASKIYLETALHSQTRLIVVLRAAQRDAEALRADVEKRQADAKVAFDAFTQRTLALQAAREQVDAVRQQALAVEQTEESLLTEARNRKAEFEAQIAALQGDSRSLAALLRARQSGTAPPAHAGLLSSPIPGAVVTSLFGPRVHPIYGTVRMHEGIDLRGAFGTPILAAADGDVVWAGPRGGYGNMTVIDHGNSIATGYGHQSTILVNVGDHVARGQVIGLVGSTGLSTGPHLHFEVRANGTPVNPLDYL